MKLVIIESPFRGDLEKNLRYAHAAIKDSLNHGEAPFASHLLYTGALNDNDMEERALGIKAGWAWMERADLVAVYLDLGISEGMKRGINTANNIGLIIEYRKLY